MTTEQKVPDSGAVAGPVDWPVRRVDLNAIRSLASGQDDVKSMALRECAAELWMLRRWKSIHAPRLQVLEGLLHNAQLAAAKGAEALATLESERAANAILTSEVERLRALLSIPASECTHQCRKCMHRYVPEGMNEDCPLCGHDGKAPNTKLTGPSGSARS
jgi:rubrerythrin